MKYVISFFVLFLSSMYVSGVEKNIIPTFYDHQKEVLIDGGSATLSQKENSILMFQTSKNLKGRRGNFYFSMMNLTDESVNFYPSNLRVTDQRGRSVRVVTKEELLSSNRRENNTLLFLSAISTGLGAYNASNTGTMNYQTQSRTINNRGLYSTTTSYGTIHSEGLRQQAVRNVEIDGAVRNSEIKKDFKDTEYGISNFYLDANTIFPESEYAANFQIDIPKEIETELEYLIFTYCIGSEEHSFCYHCPDVKRGSKRRKRG